MENSFNTSFIPKKSLQAGGETPYVKRRKIYGPGFFLMTIVFTLSIGVSAALFFYTSSIERSIDRKIQQVNQTRQGLRPDVVAELSRMDSKLNAAKTLIAEHYLTSNVMTLLESLTLLNVQYVGLEYYRPSPKEGVTVESDTPQQGVQAPVVKVRGRAKDLDTLALQVDFYRTSEYLKNVDLTTVLRDIKKSPETGFEVTMQVDARLLTKQDSAFSAQSVPAVAEEPMVNTDETKMVTPPDVSAVAPEQGMPVDATGQSDGSI